MTQAAGLLRTAGLRIEGVLTDASNLTARVLLLDADDAETGQRAIYKPLQGEAPLRDFPSGTLGRREVAAGQVSQIGGWDLIPTTIWRDGPLGPGSVQQWIDWEQAGQQPGEDLLEIFPAGEVPPGWLTVIHGEDAAGSPIAVAHRDRPDLASLVVLDLVLNNADRKGAHMVQDATGRLWGVDHGLTLHTEPKLRTVLWGWAGQPLPAADQDRLARLQHHLSTGGGPLPELISEAEVAALRERTETLLADPVFPAPPVDRYGLPWPLW